MSDSPRRPAIRIRRSSDNVEADIGRTEDGKFDVAAFRAFVGSDDAFVVKVYAPKIGQ
jgi:hypothetical protein